MVEHTVTAEPIRVSPPEAVVYPDLINLLSDNLGYTLKQYGKNGRMVFG